MEVVVIGVAALLASGLTLFSGFGLGTILTPVFALFYPVPVAIAATAVVHFANNLFKLGLLGKDACWPVVVRFGLPAALAAVAGAALLNAIGTMPVAASYDLIGRVYEITVVKFVIGCLIVGFALLDLWPGFQGLAFAPRWLWLGGLISGFFGGLSGNQGALRSAFLVKAGLSKEAFVATNAVAAVIVDATRLAVYGSGFLAKQLDSSRELGVPVGVGVLAAFAGAYVGKRYLRKITLRTVHAIVAAAMVIIGLGLAAGWI
jgi:uncharacterized protein